MLAAAGFVTAPLLAPSTPIDITDGTAAHSSGYNGDTYPASLAINGATGDFTHTNGSSDTDPVWQVVIPAPQAFTGIVLHNRDNCCQLRLSDITVQVLNFTGDVNSDFGTFDRVMGSGSDGGTVVFTSETLNPLNELSGPPEIFVDLLAANGGAPVTGNMIRVHRLNSGVANGGAPIQGHDQSVISLGEVVALGVGPTLVITAAEVRMTPTQTLSLEIGSVDDQIEGAAAVEVSVNTAGLPAGMTVDLTNDAGVVTATVNTNATPAGRYPLTVTAKNSSDLTHTGEFWVYVPMGLVAHYKLDEATNAALVDDTGRYSGTWAGTPPLFGQTEVPAGATGTSVYFNGSDAAWGQAPGADAFRSGQFSVSFWAKTDPQNSWRTPVAHLGHPDDGPSGGWIMEYGDDAYGPHYMGMSVWDQGGGQYWMNSPFAPDGEWHHWVGLFDGQREMMFMDGAPLAARTANYYPQMRDDRGMTIGANFQWGEFMNGYIDDVQFYDHGIGFSDILELLNNPGSTVANIDPRIYMTTNTIMLPPSASDTQTVGWVFDPEDAPGLLALSVAGAKAGAPTVSLANDNGNIVATVDTTGADPGMYEFTLLVTDSGGDSSMNLLTIAVEGIMAHYKLDDASTATTLVDSINGFDATINGSITLGGAGVDGTAAQFAGDANSYAIVDQLPDLNLPVFSVAFWCVGDPAGGHEAPVGARGFDRNSENGWTIYYEGGNAQFWVHNDAGTGWTTISTPTDTGLHHYVATFNGRQLKLYKDGVEAATPVNYSGNYANRSSGSLIFGRNGGGFPFTGVVDDVQYYLRVLTADEAMTLYQNPGSTIANRTAVSDWMILNR